MEGAFGPLNTYDYEIAGTAWMPHPRRTSDMNEASTPYVGHPPDRAV
jgi:hypothetical protein